MMVTCSEPLTNIPPRSPCGCVWPLQVKLHISIAIYKFYPLVFKLAEEIAASLLLGRNQVRIVGANAANHQLEKTRKCLLDLVKEENLRKLVENCTSSHKQFENKVSQFKQTFGAVKR
ncbi:hypothetical protein HN51_032271 [Arachis hypogaea]